MSPTSYRAAPPRMVSILPECRAGSNVCSVEQACRVLWCARVGGHPIPCGANVASDGTICAGKRNFPLKNESSRVQAACKTARPTDIRRMAWIVARDRTVNKGVAFRVDQRAECWPWRWVGRDCGGADGAGGQDRAGCAGGGKCPEGAGGHARPGQPADDDHDGLWRRDAERVGADRGAAHRG
jgi:hypothetical protein